MSNKAMDWAWEQDLPPMEKLVLVAMADNASEDGICWPGQKFVAKKCGIKRESVNRVIKRLIKKGKIKLEHRYDDEGRQKSNRYILDLFGCDAGSHRGDAKSQGSVTEDHREGDGESQGEGDGESHRTQRYEPTIEPKERTKEPPITPQSDKQEKDTAPAQAPTLEVAKNQSSPAKSKKDHPGFENFWKLYPRRVNRQQALKAWNKLKPDDQLQATIHAAIKRQSRTEQWIKDSGKFIPHASTWLNGCRWEDEDREHRRPKFYGIPGLGAGI